MKNLVSVEYVDYYGSVVAGKTCSQALCLWLMKNKFGDGKPKNSIVHGPYTKGFALGVISEIESKYGKAPEIDSVILKKEWYDTDMPEDKFNPLVIYQYKKTNSKVKKYEAWCETVLEWLAVFGDIKQIKFHT